MSGKEQTHLRCALRIFSGRNRNLLNSGRRQITNSQRNPNFNQKPTLRKVGCFHRASVQPDGLIGNCQSQANAAGGASASVVNPVKRMEDFLKEIGRNAGSAIPTRIIASFPAGALSARILTVVPSSV